MRADTARVAVFAVLAMLGGALWVSLPVTTAEVVPWAWVSIASLALGALVGAACVVAAQPQVSRAAVVLAAPLVVAVVRAVAELLDGRSLTVQATDAVMVGGAVASAGLGVVLARILPGRAGRIGAAAFVQLAILVLTSIALVLADSGALSLFGLLAAAFLGGAVVVRLLPAATGGEVVLAWVLLLVAAFTTAALATTPARLMVVVIVATVMAPIPAGLAALGASVARRAPPMAPLPDATVVR